MRWILQAVCVMLLSCGSFCQFGMAQEEVKAKTYEGELHLNSFLVNSSNITSDVSADVSQVTPESAAPGLSYISTYNTCGQATSTSTLVCENDSSVGTTTKSYPTTMYKIYEVVRIHGYGTTPIARLGGSSGSLVPSSDIVETDYLCTSSYTICTTGQTVTGFQYWFDLTSMLDGGYSRLFYTQSTGINNPSTTLSATLFISK